MSGLEIGLGVGVLVWAAFAFDILGFLARDELVLRLLMLVAMLFYIAYYALVTEAPLWDAILTNGTLATVNLVMICIVVAERTTWLMSPSDRDLYTAFRPLSPGQFRRLLRMSDRRQVAETLSLLRQGERPERLYFVTSGAIAIDKSGQTGRIDAPAFLGEIAFLRGTPATATVSALPGAEVLGWPVAPLRRALDRSPAFRNAFLARLNDDLLTKVGASPPRPDPA